MGETLLIGDVFKISELRAYNSFSSEFCAEFDFRFDVFFCYNSEYLEKMTHHPLAMRL